MKLDPLRFVEEHGVVLASARGPVPSVAEAVAGTPIRGSWWAHPRGKQIFAALPYTRTPSVPDSFMFKFERPNPRTEKKLRADKRIVSEQGIGTRWFIFRISSPQDLHSAVEWLSHAYETAKAARR